MQYFTWGINPPGVDDARSALIEEHWTYMDRFNDRLIARGPTLNDANPPGISGSVHVVALDDDREARSFADEEPFAKAGLFETLILTGFESALERRMFDFNHDPALPHFLIYCPSGQALDDRVRSRHEEYARAHDAAYLCRGHLLDKDGGWAGTAALIEMADRPAAEALLAGDPVNTAGLYDKTILTRWTPGGRANLNPAGRLGD